MEATGVFWRPVWHVLAGCGFGVLLVNPAHIKNVPGRKTDVNDATWIAQLLECGLLRGSFVPPTEISQHREITRYRRQLTEERAREVQRLQELLEDANVKLSSVGTDYLAGKDLPERRRRLLVAQLEHLGYTVNLSTAA